MRLSNGPAVAWTVRCPGMARHLAIQEERRLEVVLEGGADGHWVFDESDRGIWEGPVVGGNLHGLWVRHNDDDGFTENCWRNGERMAGLSTCGERKTEARRMGRRGRSCWLLDRRSFFFLTVPARPFPALVGTSDGRTPTRSVTGLALPDSRVV